MSDKYIPVIQFQYTADGVMQPVQRFLDVCAKQFEVGEIYRMEVVEERSEASHRHYFAQISDCWKNLPEDKAAEYPSPEALRKRALIKCGYYHDKSIVCETPEQAVRVGAFIKPLDEFAVVIVKDNVVKHYRAKSQSHHEMDKQEFAESKEKVLALLADLIGVTKTELAKEGKR